MLEYYCYRDSLSRCESTQCQNRGAVATGSICGGTANDRFQQTHEQGLICGGTQGSLSAKPMSRMHPKDMTLDFKELPSSPAESSPSLTRSLPLLGSDVEPPGVAHRQILSL